MSISRLFRFAVASFCMLAPVSGEPSDGYVNPALCAGCHSEIAQNYRSTGMGRSFYRPRPENTVEDFEQNNSFYHRASDRYYKTYRKDGKYYQLRYQVGFDDKETNVVEKEIHYVIGSGNHARTYLHQTPEGALIQLPMGWYAEKGGQWAMSPGYDRPDHLDFRRRITYECMFCHNAYPAGDAVDDTAGGEPLFKGSMPEGIDCQRCHGPGQAHVQAVQGGKANRDAERRGIVNPSKLSTDLQMELCMQCHLESTTFPLPYSVRRYSRGVFSYQPGQTLADYLLHFEPPSGTKTFEINHAGYRLRESACFTQSQASGRQMTCTTCHDPHHALRGDDAVRHYTAACRSCHEPKLRALVEVKRHTQAPDCLGCHMPKRRTNDVVHAVMTDHFIQRQAPGRDLMAPLDEPRDESMAHKGPVVAYYPRGLRPGTDDELYLAVAHVRQSANLKQGIPHLEKAIQVRKPERAEFYYELAEAYSKNGQTQQAADMYGETLRRKPDFVPALRGLGQALEKSGKLTEAAAVFEQLRAIAPRDTLALSHLGVIAVQLARPREGVALIQKSLEVNPDQPEAHNTLGVALGQMGERSLAEGALREAIRLQPDFAQAHNNLAGVLAGAGDFRQAAYHWEKAIGYDPNYVAARFNYALALGQQRLFEKAQTQLEEVLRLDANRADAHNLLGELLVKQGQVDRALVHYRKALDANPRFAAAYSNLGAALAALGKLKDAETNLRAALQWNPDDVRAHLYLGRVLLARGQMEEAVLHLNAAARSTEEQVREAAAGLLKNLPRQ
jgi:tetratricopeptide (TPR) repeat protein